jgi:hypothetical protein
MPSPGVPRAAKGGGMTRAPTSYCGDTSADHRSTRCRPCLRIRMRRWRAQRRAANPPVRPRCALCGKGWDVVPVYRYPLVRNIRGINSNRCIGSLALCDPCVVEYATPSPSYMKAHGLTKREWRRSYMPRERAAA